MATLLWPAPLFSREPVSTESLPHLQNHGTPAPRSLLRKNDAASRKKEAPFSLDSTTRPEVREAIIKFLRNPEKRKFITESLERGLFYRRYIARIIAEYQMPPELLYLPVLESAYRAEARSWAGATGLWQFMPGTARPRGLSINEWQDDRLDFWKATPAAMEELQQNYRATGDWYLALAAYNCGLGRINRIIKETGISDYWELREKGHLPGETTSYVPDFLAVAHLGAHPARFGLSLNWKEAPVWQNIVLNQGLDLKILSRKSGIPYDILKRGNTSFIQDLTPPTTRNLSLKIPEPYHHQLTQFLQTNPQPLVNFHRYTIQPGDTLSHMVNHYRIPLDLLLQYNPGVSPRHLAIGQKIIIPLLQERPIYQGRIQAPPEVDIPFTEEYVIKKGDSLWAIARAYNTSAQEVARKNALALDTPIQPGMTLKVPGHSNPASAGEEGALF